MRQKKLNNAFCVIPSAISRREIKFLNKNQNICFWGRYFIMSLLRVFKNEDLKLTIGFHKKDKIKIHFSVGLITVVCLGMIFGDWVGV